MKQWNLLIGGAIVIAMTVAPASIALAAPPELSLHGLTVERTDSPLGVDSANPLFGWVLDALEPGATQSAYEIEVSALEDLSSPVWDSGKVASSSSYDLAYAGAALESQALYYWRVRAWDGHDSASAWSTVASFETAFLNPDEFGGDWIGSPNRAPETSMAGANWIWHSADGSPVPAGQRYFRSTLTIPDGANVTSAQVQMTADDYFVLYVNGQEAIASPTTGDAWSTLRVTDIAAYLHDGANTLAVVATNSGGPFGVGGDAGLLGRVHIVTTNNGTIDTQTDSSWLSSSVLENGWQNEGFADSGWAATTIVAAYGSGPWGTSATAPAPPEPLLRRDFTVSRTVASARAYVSGLGYYKLYLNGERVGNHELDPGFTIYDKTTLYATYDVTDAVSSGQNAVGVSLGRGYFGQLQPDEWGSSAWHDDTKLKIELVITFTDGTTQRVVSDEDWTAADGPTTSESVWFGETYDARREQSGWATAGFDDSAWMPAARVAGPGGTLTAQLFPAIEITQDLPVVEVTQPVPGTFVYDFGRPTAGWADVGFTGAAGSRVDMKYGERLHDDGTVDNDNVFFTIQNYAYILKGGGAESFHPSYSYAGFRYLQVTVPSGVAIGDVIGQRLHSAVQRTGDFTSSSSLLDAYNDAQADTILNNLHSIPTDTPMYEKRAYGADAFLMADSAIALFDMQTFFANWMNTHLDDQSADGTFGNTVPGSVGSKSTTDPVWSSSYVAISWDLYQAYGDTRVLEQNYDGLKKWMDHYSANIGSTGGVYTGFSYGDWLSPAGANPPEGTSLVATAYLFQGATRMSAIAAALGRTGDATLYSALADQIYASFNATFYDASAGVYVDDPAAGYRQTSNAIPLSFGLVPAEEKTRVLTNLVADIETRENHLNTGSLGTKELLPVLTENGYADLAYSVATNPTYPGWGYWFTELGATTMWEEWGANSRSHDHAFLGTVVDWLYEDVAGIEPGAPGYSTVRIKPYSIEGLDSAAGEVDSPNGVISSSWTRNAEEFVLDISVPVGSTAEVYVPVEADDKVSVSPIAASTTRGPVTDGFASFTVGSGDYRFAAGVLVDPGLPSEPAEPGEPSDPGPSDPGSPADPAQSGGADAGGDGLASTGVEVGVPIAIALLMVLSGAVVLTRRRARQRV